MATRTTSQRHCVECGATFTAYENRHGVPYKGYYCRDHDSRSDHW